MVLSIIDRAREKKLHIPLIAPAGTRSPFLSLTSLCMLLDAGNYAFYAAFGCLPIGEPIKTGPDNTVEGVSL